MARSTALLMVAFGVAKAISLAQVFIIANVFGLSAEWDAFVTANSIPELLVVLIGGGRWGMPLSRCLAACWHRDSRKTPGSSPAT